MMSPLTYIMGLPLAMALILAVVPSEKRQYFRWGARLATLGSLLLAIYVFSAFDPTTTEQPRATNFDSVPSIPSDLF